MNCADLPGSQALPPRMTQWPALLRVAEAVKAPLRMGAAVGVLLIAACAGIEHAPQPEASPQAAPMAATAERTSTADKATQPSVVPPATPVQGAAKAAAAPTAKSQTPAAAPAKPQAAAPLDLKSLEARLKETQAIGVFTKLTLKNQIDELLDRFRAFHQGKLKTSLADLRRSYDMLVLKVLALLQDADPPLAGAIAGSREAIWGILSDPAKFAAV